MLKLRLLLILILFIGACKTEPKKEHPPYRYTDNTVHARLPAEPDRLNPILSTSVYGRAVHQNIFFYLLDFDRQTLELSPQLAKSRPDIKPINSGPDAGGLSYTFELHEEVSWDNGQPVTGKDFEFTLKVLFNPFVNAAAVRSYLDFVTDIEIDPNNNKRFTVFTNKKYIVGEAVISNIPVIPDFVYDPQGMMANISLRELTQMSGQESESPHKAVLQQFAEAFNSPQFSREKGFIEGCGPYRFVEWITGDRVVLQKKENWWGAKLAQRYPTLKAHPDQLIFKIIPDQTATLAALKDQQVDVASQIDTKDFVDLQQNPSFTSLFDLESPSSLIYYYVGIQTQNPKLSDKRVRWALAHLTNVDQLIEDLFFGLGERTIGPVHPAKPYYHKKLSPIPFDPEKAVALLAEAGWEDTNGNGIVDKVINGELLEMELEFSYGNSSRFAENQVLLFQNDAKKAGVKIIPVPKEFTILIDDLKKRDFELFSSAWGQDPILDDFKQLWHTDSDTPDGSNRVGFGNAVSDQLIEDIRITLDENKRNELYLQFQELIYEEQPYIFLFVPLERLAIHKRFEAKTSALRPGFFVKDFVIK